jgi:hypothetical protein
MGLKIYGALYVTGGPSLTRPRVTQVDHTGADPYLQPTIWYLGTQEHAPI